MGMGEPGMGGMRPGGMMSPDPMMGPGGGGPMMGGPGPMGMHPGGMMGGPGGMGGGMGPGMGGPPHGGNMNMMGNMM